MLLGTYGYYVIYLPNPLISEWSQFVTTNF